jgi:hypothetical protein
MPAFKNHNTTIGVPKAKGPHAHSGFNETDPYFPERNLQITGITKDSAGSALGNCMLVALDTQNDQDSIGPFVSDAAGNYLIPIPKGLNQVQTTTWRIDAYKTGSPDVAGSTVNTLVGA